LQVAEIAGGEHNPDGASDSGEQRRGQKVGDYEILASASATKRNN
jgi:hypothetical protein